MPLSVVVEIIEKPGFSTIKRTDGYVTVSVVADYDDNAGNPNDVLTSIGKDTPSQIAAKYNIDFAFGGRNQEEMETMGSPARAPFWAWE